LANAGKQSVKGFEIEASYSPIDPLNLFMGLTYLDPNYDSYLNAPCPSAEQRGFNGTDITQSPGFIADEFLQCVADGEPTVDLTGEDPNSIHPVSLSTAATYTHDFANGSSLIGRIEYLFESETNLFDGAGPNGPTRKTSTINANLLYRMENGFSVNVWGRNLNDDDALITAFPGVAQAGTLNGYVVAPRTYGVTIKKAF